MFNKMKITIMQNEHMHYFYVNTSLKYLRDIMSSISQMKSILPASWTEVSYNEDCYSLREVTANGSEEYCLEFEFMNTDAFRVTFIVGGFQMPLSVHLIYSLRCISVNTILKWNRSSNNAQVKAF